MISGPLHEVVDTVKDAEGGDLTKRIDADGAGEIASQMVQHLLIICRN